MKKFIVFLSAVCFLIPQLGFSADQGSAKDELSLDNLGFSPEQLKANEVNQTILTARTHKLQIHQVLGLVTLGLMGATVLTAPDDAPASDLHVGLGIATAASYAATAYYSLSAPEAPSATGKGWNIRIHKALMFVHLPGMILTPIAGFAANQQLKHSTATTNGERQHQLTGLARYKGELASLTFLSYAAAAISISFDF